MVARWMNEMNMNEQQERLLVYVDATRRLFEKVIVSNKTKNERKMLFQIISRV